MASCVAVPGEQGCYHIGWWCLLALLYATHVFELKWSSFLSVPFILFLGKCYCSSALHFFAKFSARTTTCVVIYTWYVLATTRIYHFINVFTFYEWLISLIRVASRSAIVHNENGEWSNIFSTWNYLVRWFLVEKVKVSVDKDWTWKPKQEIGNRKKEIQWAGMSGKGHKLARCPYTPAS